VNSEKKSVEEKKKAMEENKRKSEKYQYEVTDNVAALH
jgi:hypothetical protein